MASKASAKPEDGLSSAELFSDYLDGIEADDSAISELATRWLNSIGYLQLTTKFPHMFLGTELNYQSHIAMLKDFGDRLNRVFDSELVAQLALFLTNPFQLVMAGD